MENDDRNSSPAQRVVVVGPCASGKSTLVATLRAHGFDAHVTAQEHSAVPKLWKRAHPDILIALVASIDAVRERRDASWPGWLHDVQEERLADAQDAADLVIDTSQLDSDAVAERAMRFLNCRRTA